MSKLFSDVLYILMHF